MYFEITCILLSGLSGAIFALVGNHLVSKRSTEMQMKTTVLSTFLTARLDAYKAFENAMSQWSQHRDGHSCEEVYRCANIVTLIASEQTILDMHNVQDAVRKFETSGKLPDLDKFRRDKLMLQISMHNDLLSYRAPNVDLSRAKMDLGK